jgi:hypothetical protein
MLKKTNSSKLSSAFANYLNIVNFSDHLKKELEVYELREKTFGEIIADSNLSENEYNVLKIFWENYIESDKGIEENDETEKYYKEMEFMQRLIYQYYDIVSKEKDEKEVEETRKEINHYTLIPEIICKLNDTDFNCWDKEKAEEFVNKETKELLEEKVVKKIKELYERTLVKKNMELTTRGKELYDKIVRSDIMKLYHEVEKNVSKDCFCEILSKFNEEAASLSASISQLSGEVKRKKR